MANLPMCSDDELRVIDRFVQRIHNARREYGPLRIKRDTRDYRHEAAAEAFDACFYLCLEDVRRASGTTVPTRWHCEHCGVVWPFGHMHTFTECAAAKVRAAISRQGGDDVG